MRKRLRVVQMVLKGATVRRAAKAANVWPGTIETWLRIARAGGCAGLLAIGPRTLGHSAPDNALREQIRMALAGELNLRLRKRLVAIDRLLAGERLEQVAGEMRIYGGKLGLWITELRKTGFSDILGWKDNRACFRGASTLTLRAVGNPIYNGRDAFVPSDQNGTTKST
jgi:Helix-turn-helix domain